MRTNKSILEIEHQISHKVRICPLTVIVDPAPPSPSVWCLDKYLIRKNWLEKRNDFFYISQNFCPKRHLTQQTPFFKVADNSCKNNILTLFYSFIGLSFVFCCIEVSLGYLYCKETTYGTKYPRKDHAKFKETAFKSFDKEYL